MPDTQPHSGFPASVQVHTPEGLVPIGQLRAGDLVRSTDVASGQSGDWPVLETHVLPAVRIGSISWFHSAAEGWLLAGCGQRFWVTTDEPDERFRIPRDGPAPTGWVPAEGPRSTWGSLRGWVELGDLFWGDQWIVAATVPAVAGWGEGIRVVQQGEPGVAWVEQYRGADEGAEFTFDEHGAITAIRTQVVENVVFEEPFVSPTRQLTVERGHSFHVLEAGLLAADHVNPGGPLMATINNPERDGQR